MLAAGANLDQVRDLEEQRQVAQQCPEALTRSASSRGRAKMVGVLVESADAASLCWPSRLMETRCNGAPL